MPSSWSRPSTARRAVLRTLAASGPDSRAHVEIVEGARGPRLGNRRTPHPAAPFHATAPPEPPEAMNWRVRVHTDPVHLPNDRGRTPPTPCLRSAGSSTSRRSRYPRLRHRTRRPPPQDQISGRPVSDKLLEPGWTSGPNRLQLPSYAPALNPLESWSLLRRHPLIDGCLADTGLALTQQPTTTRRSQYQHDRFRPPETGADDSCGHCD